MTETKKPNIFKRLFAKLVSEPAVTVAVVVAAINAATVQTWEGYGVAVVTALLRFVVSPAYEVPTEPEK